MLLWRERESEKKELRKTKANLQYLFLFVVDVVDDAVDVGPCGVGADERTEGAEINKNTFYSHI